MSPKGTPLKVTTEGFSEPNNSDYNIVVLGPTGAGKSTIINNLFNQNVCVTGATAESVTREVRFFQGTCDQVLVYSQIKNTTKTVKKRLNVIDTIGKCKYVQFFDRMSTRTEHLLMIFSQMMKKSVSKL